MSQNEVSSTVLEASKLLKQLQDEAFNLVKNTIHQKAENVFKLSAFVIQEKGSVISTSAIGRWSVKFYLNEREVEIIGEYDQFTQPKEIAGKVYLAIRGEIDTMIMGCIGETLKSFLK